MICHYRWFYERIPGVFPEDVSLRAERFLWPAYEYGGLAVPLFWILSGFLFGIAYARFGKGISIREFWLRRLSQTVRDIARSGWPRLNLSKTLCVHAVGGVAKSEGERWESFCAALRR